MPSRVSSGSGFRSGGKSGKVSAGAGFSKTGSSKTPARQGAAPVATTKKASRRKIRIKGATVAGSSSTNPWAGGKNANLSAPSAAPPVSKPAAAPGMALSPGVQRTGLARSKSGGTGNWSFLNKDRDTKGRFS
jgi:hypothetical protein